MPRVTDIATSIFVKHGTMAVASVLAIWLAFSIILMFHPAGYMYEDEFCHFALARDSIHSLKNFVYVWQRPGLSALHVLPAQAGFQWARATSLAVSLLAIAAIYSLGKQGPSKSGNLAVLFALVQPFFVLDSYTVMTEVPFALFLALGLLLWVKKKGIAAALAFSALPLFRPEGFILLPVLALAIIASNTVPTIPRRILCLLCLGVGTAIWVGLGWYDSGNPFFLYSDNTYRQAPTGIYGSGDIFGQLFNYVVCVGGIVAILALIGTVRLIRRKQYLFPALSIAFVGFHVILYYFGLWGEAKLERYFVAILPVTAILASEGVISIGGLVRPKIVSADARLSLWHRAGSFQALLIAFCVLVFLLHTCLHVALGATRPVYGNMQKSLVWLKEYSRNNPVPTVVSEHPFYVVWLGIDKDYPKEHCSYSSTDIQNLPPGSIILYDTACANADKDRGAIPAPVLNQKLFKEIAVFEDTSRFGTVKAYRRQDSSAPSP